MIHMAMDRRINFEYFWNRKCNDTKKAERFFLGTWDQFQFDDMKERGMVRVNLIQFAQSK